MQEELKQSQTAADKQVANILPGELAHRVREIIGSSYNQIIADRQTDLQPGSEWDLVTEGLLSEADLLEVYSEATGLPLAQKEDFEDLVQLPDLSEDFLRAHDCLPLEWNTARLVLAVSTPYALGELTYLMEAILNIGVTFLLARRSMVEQSIGKIYADREEAEGSTALNTRQDEETLKDLAQEAPIVRLVSDIFNRAVEMRASDIHVEPGEEELTVRFRVDGMLQTVLKPPLSYYAAIASRLKLTAGMNIAERRLPQDGRTDLTVAGRHIDVRVSTVPGMKGESIVLRLLEKETTLLDLDGVGLQDEALQRFQRLIHMPYGIVLVVGPTGSGKTTTLYGVMKLLNSDDQKIITIEDPVEYQIEGLTQIQVRPQIGLTFANGLRSIVRQDPDIILVGEIRDRETAEIAVHAALTGHLVFSTLHTNDAAGAISRLLEMGVEGFLISSALLGVVSQRLVRTVCPECKGGSPGTQLPENRRSCRSCGGTGFRGRTGIFEVLVADADIRNAINEHKDTTEIARLARQSGMKTLNEAGMRKIEDGLTTRAEVERVCQIDNLE
ncbi:MAG: GspE/PulE family protein [Lentisphaeria bacterium]